MKEGLKKVGTICDGKYAVYVDEYMPKNEIQKPINPPDSITENEARLSVKVVALEKKVIELESENATLKDQVKALLQRGNR
jgi:hypothetical protein